MPTELWDRTYGINVRDTYLTTKHFLKSVESSQRQLEKELDIVSIMMIGSEREPLIEFVMLFSH